MNKFKQWPKFICRYAYKVKYLEKMVNVCAYYLYIIGLALNVFSKKKIEMISIFAKHRYHVCSRILSCFF